MRIRIRAEAVVDLESEFEAIPEEGMHERLQTSLYELLDEYGVTAKLDLDVKPARDQA